MNSISRSLLLAALLAAPAAAFAQFGATPPGMNPELTKLFGVNTAFSSQAELLVENPAQKQHVSTAMKFSLLDGKTRVDIDMTSLASKMHPEAAAHMKAMGMDQVVFVSLPDQKKVVQIYPGLRGYIETAMPENQAAAATANYKIEKTSAGKETIDGHACEKNNVTLTNDKGEKKEFLVWNAADLQDFPLRLQMTEQGSTITINYKEVKLEKPEAKLFDAPTEFTKYENQMDLMQGVMLKQRPGAPSK